MNTSHDQTTVVRLSLIGLLLVLLGFPVFGQAPGQVPFRLNPSHNESLNNIIRLSLGSPMVDGSVAQYAQRHRVPDGVYGGLEALHYESFVGSSGTFTVDGRAIPGNDEYRFNLDYDTPDAGFIRAGIDNYKIRYDGAGGYFHPLDKQFAPRQSQLGIDRGDLYVEAGLRKPDVPGLTVRFQQRTRDGMKPSTSWGDSRDLDDFGTRNIVPSFWMSDETRNIVDARAEHGFGSTNVHAGLRYETGDVENSLNVWRRPGESAERFLTDKEIQDLSGLNVFAGAVTRFSDNASLTLNISRSTLDNDLSGDRIYGPDFGSSFNPSFENNQRRDHGFIDISGTTSRTLNSGMATLRLRAGDFVLVPGVKVEMMDFEGSLNVTDTNVQSDGSVTQTPLVNTGEREVTDLTGTLELRFEGIDNVVVYARGDLMDRSGSILEEEALRDTGEEEFRRETDDTKSSYRVVLGLTMHPAKSLRLAAKAYRKTRTVEYDHVLNADGPLTYPGFLLGQDLMTDNLNFSFNWKPDMRFSLSGRYDVSKTTIEGTAEPLETFESGDLLSRAISGDIVVAPVEQFYIHGSVTLMENHVMTPINSLTGDVKDIVLESQNDYLSAQVSLGAVLTEQFTLSAGLFYLDVDNFIDNSDISLPYDMSVEETGISAEGAYEFTKDIMGSVRYYHFINRDVTFGGNPDYDLNLVSVGLTYRF